MKSTELQEVFIDELKDIYSAESQLIKALPKIAAALVTPELIKAVESHLAETKEQAKRLEEVLKSLDSDTKGPACAAMKGILEEGSKFIEDIEEGPVRDAALIGGCQKVEHYEIASYGTVIEWATILGHTEQAAILQSTLDEEKAADDKLTEIATGMVNAKATGKGSKSNGQSKTDSKGDSSRFGGSTDKTKERAGVTTDGKSRS